MESGLVTVLLKHQQEIQDLANFYHRYGSSKDHNNIGVREIDNEYGWFKNHPISTQKKTLRTWAAQTLKAAAR